jgi:uncharacterized Zn-binding protein involved in type VI secretion
MTNALAAARIGDRTSHSPDVSNHDAALLAVATSALAAVAGMAGALTAAIGAGVASAGGGGGVSLRDVIPKSVAGSISEGSPRTFLGADNLAAAVAEAEPVDCHHHRDGPIQTGSVSVFVDGLRMARAQDQTHCGATLCDGDKTILIGGEPAGGKPPDPMALAAKGAALASVAVGAAVAAGTSAVETAMRWAESMSGRAASAAAKAEEQIDSAAAALAAQAGALLGEARDGLGALLGTKLASG